ncbi:MAG: hypothetical protein U1F68_19370 [Gammaproteobacteria bacterium]
MAALIRLENSREPSDVLRVLEALGGWLQAPEQTRLRRAFTVWLRRVLRNASSESTPLAGVEDLDEVKVMLAERVQQWEQRWRERSFAAGLEQGMSQGIEQGIEQGMIAERALLYRQARHRFGEPTATTLAEWLERIDAAERLAEIGEWLVTSTSADELLERVKARLAE